MKHVPETINKFVRGSPKNDSEKSFIKANGDLLNSTRDGTVYLVFLGVYGLYNNYCLMFQRCVSYNKNSLARNHKNNIISL